jgi:molecular chaperone Hsp33
MNDTLQRFLFENADIRGDLVRLDSSWQTVIDKHDYPPAVRKLLGEMMVASVLLSATLKYKGRLTIQIVGEGPVSLMVVECTSERTLRGLAHSTDDINTGNLAELVGKGRLAITLEPEQTGERYQSIVELTGDSLADAIENYLDVSEQLETKLWFAVNDESAAGLLIQKLPDSGTVKDEDSWNRVQQLSSTIEIDELLLLSARDIIHRLYHEEDIRVFEPESVYFRCSCSRNRVENMLRTLGVDEVRSVIEDEGCIDVACEFCNHKYLFDAVDAEQIFLDTVQSINPNTEH